MYFCSDAGGFFLPSAFLLTFSGKRGVRLYRNTENRFGAVTQIAGSGSFRQGTCARRKNAIFALTFLPVYSIIIVIQYDRMAELLTNGHAAYGVLIK